MIIQKASIILLCAFAFILPGHNPVSSAVTGSENTGTEYNSHTVDAKKPSSDSKSMPSNPSVALPDTVNRSIPDNATVVSPRLASMSNGVVKDLVTGDTVTDPALVGSPEEQPDPLAKTNGHQFIPVSVARVKDSFSQKNAGESDGSDSAREGAQGAGMMDKEMARGERQSSRVRPVSLVDGGVHNAAYTVPGNQYGAYWGNYNSQPAFFERNGTLFAQQARPVIDVSSWQQDISWQAVKDAGIQGVIIRLSYGWGNHIDRSAEYNISECRRLNIPFGLYVYSYAANGSDGRAEASDVLAKLRSIRVSAGDLRYPIFYDLEQWTDSGRTPATSSNTYNDIVNSWFSGMEAGGFGNLQIYSYPDYLNGPLNSSNIHSKTGWVASYGPSMGFAFQLEFRGWQYSDVGNVPGIQGHVDLSAFGNKSYVDDNPAGEDPSMSAVKVLDISEGDYYVVSSYPHQVVDIAWAGKNNGDMSEIWQYIGGSNQVFHIKPVGNGRYMLIACHSEKALDVNEGHSANGTRIIQYRQQNSPNQQWEIYRTAEGSLIFKSMVNSSKNRVLDIVSGNSSNGAPLDIWGFNRGVNQRFQIAPVGTYRSGSEGWISLQGKTYWYTNGVRAVSREVVDPASGLWYYVDAAGQRVTGWRALADGRRVYYDPSNYAMIHGEKCISGYWYFFDALGNMACNRDVWLPAEQKWVRYDSSGHMVYGENYFRGGWYYFDSYSGAMVKGWKYLAVNQGKWVYYDLISGRMVHGESCIAGNWYYFDDFTGATTYGWKLLGGNRWVYYDSTFGWMLKGWHAVDGRMRHFDDITGAVLN